MECPRAPQRTLEFKAAEIGCSSFIRRLGLTLVELLTSISIIAVLIGIALPGVQAVREASRRTACSNRLRQIGIALHSFESAKRHLPSGLTGGNANSFAFSSWLVHLLPQLERYSEFDQASADYQSSSNPFFGHALLQRPLNNFICPADPRTGIAHFTHGNRLVAHTDYLGVGGTNHLAEDGVFYLDSRIRFHDITDGLSNTLMVGERPPSPDFWYGWWYAGMGQAATGSADMHLGVRELKAPPVDGETTYLEECSDGPYAFGPGDMNETCDTLHFWSHHPGGAHFAMCDASVRFFAYADEGIVSDLSTRNSPDN